MQSLLRDVRYGWRMLLKKPGFTIVAALALALGIGANSAIFSIVNAILLNPLPFNDLDRIVMVSEQVRGRGDERNSVAVANYLDWREQSNSFESLAIYSYWSANLGSIEPPERVRGVHVSPNLLDTVGIKVGLGRNFSLLVVGRLKAGITIGQARSDLDAVAGRLEQQYPNTNTGL